MAEKFVLKDPGEGIHEVDILDVLVSEGDEVSEGQEVLVVESDKAAVELPSPYSGIVQELRVKANDTATVGDILMVIGDGDAAPSSEDENGEEDGDSGEAVAASDEKATPENEDAEAQDEEVAEAREDDGDEEATDDETSGDAQAEGDKPDAPEDKSPDAGAGDAHVRAAPAARKRAAEHGLDLFVIKATGADGEITVEDVDKAIARSAGEDGGRETGERATPDDEGADEFGEVTRRKASALRRATARTMDRSWSEIPHVWHKDVADITRLESWRQRQADNGREVALTPILIKAVVTVLRDHPAFNATLDADSGDILLRRYVNINVAVATGRGLVTPVIKGADEKTVAELAEELAEIVDRAQERGLGRAEIEGGTFTITNVGALGGRGLSPLINPPQTAILGAARAYREVVATTAGLGPVGEGDLEVRLMLPLVLAFDHRVVDGADAARFMNDLLALLEDPVTLALDA